MLIGHIQMCPLVDGLMGSFTKNQEVGDHKTQRETMETMARGYRRAPEETWSERLVSTGP